MARRGIAPDRPLSAPLRWVLKAAMAPNPYISVPRLRRNPALSAVQLLFWAIIRPSAWCTFVEQTDERLRPDCRFSDLQPPRWRHPLLLRILAGYILYVPIVLIVSWLTLTICGRSGEIFLMGMVAPVLLMGILFAVGGLWFSIAVGLVLSVLGSMAFAVGYAAAGGLGSGLGRGFVWPVALAYGVVIGLAGSIVNSITNNISVRRADQALFDWQRGLSGMFTGMLIGGLAVFTVYSVLRLFALLLFHTFPIGDKHPSSFAWIILLAVLIILFIIAVGWREASIALLINTISFFITLGIFSLSHWNLFETANLGFTLMFVTLIGLPYIMVERIAGVGAATLAGTIGPGAGWIAWMMDINHLSFWWIIPTVMCIFAGVTLTWWGSFLLHPCWQLWNQFVLRLDERRQGGRGSLLRYHSAFWDETHPLPLYNLDRYLVLVAERDPQEGQSAIAYLSTGYQRWAAQSAEIEIDARRLERCNTIQAISEVHQTLATGELASPVSALLRSFSRISQAVRAALSGTTTYHKRLALSAVESSIDQLLREMTLSSDPYALRFRPIAAVWRQVVADELRRLTAEVERNQDIDNPYIFGVPLAEHQELFVGRGDVAARIEQHLTDRRSPPLLLYGQRRMGKTSLLRNLGRLLPETTVLLFVDGEGISGARDYADFLYAVAVAMVRSAGHHRGLQLQRPDREALEASPFTGFNEWLDEVEEVLAAHASIALLALDEFEVLEVMSQRGRFDGADMLRLLRHLVQHRPRFKVLLAGSHTLDEFRHWASYLINMQVIKVSYLAPDDALTLIERPVEGFAVRYDPAASRHVLALTHGHPHFVQLLCYEIVELKNRQHPAQRRLIAVEDVEAAVPQALRTGDFFFADLSNQIGASGIAVLRFLALQGERAVVNKATLAQHCPDDIDATIGVLLRRDVIEPADGGYRFQVELIRRWYAASGDD